MEALPGVRVVELADGIAAPYCARLLADLGADVIKVEPPTGDSSRRKGPFPGDEPHPEKSGLFLSLNYNKRGVTLNLSSATGKQIFQRLVSQAQMLVADLTPGQWEQLGWRPREFLNHDMPFVLVSLAPFGLTGPYQDFQGTELVLQQLGGLTYGTPSGGVEDPLQKPPLQAGGHQAQFTAGVMGAVAALMGLSLADSLGQNHLMDVSQHDAISYFMLINVMWQQYEGMFPTRIKGRGKGQSAVPMRCRDGYFLFTAQYEDQWRKWVEFMGNPDWATEELTGTYDLRSENWDAIHLLTEGWAAGHDRADIYYAAQEKQIPVFPVYTAKELCQSPHLKARKFFLEMDHPVAGRVNVIRPPWLSSAGSWSVRRPAPVLGQDNGEVYCDLLGYSRQELMELRRMNIV